MKVKLTIRQMPSFSYGNFHWEDIDGVAYKDEYIYVVKNGNIIATIIR